MTAPFDFIGALSARLIGLSTILFAADWTAGALIPALNGIGTNPPVRAGFAAAVIVVCLVIARIFLVPARTRKILKMRETAFGQMCRALLLLITAPLLLAGGYYGVRTLDLLPDNYTIEYLAAAILVCLTFYRHFIFPGSYARRLRERHLAVSRPAKTTTEAGPQQFAVAATIPHQDSWRNRALTRVHQRAREDPSIRHDRVSPRPSELSVARSEPQKAVGGLPEYLNPALIVSTGPVILFFAGQYGLREAQFLPNAETYAYVSHLRWPIVGIGALVMMVLFAVFPTRHSRRKGQGTVFRALAGFGFGATFLGLYTVTSITVGLPGLVSLVNVGEPASVRATIAEIGPRIKRRSCNRIVYARLTGDLEPGPRKLCDVPREIWDSALPGQVLVLTGTRHPWGFRYDTISR